MEAMDTLELESFLPYRLYRLADAVSREFSRVYKDRHGLTRPGMAHAGRARPARHDDRNSARRTVGHAQDQGFARRRRAGTAPLADAKT